MVKAALIAAVLVLATCTTTPEPVLVEDPREVWCAHSDARRPTLAVVEAMSRAEMDVAWCGWKP